MKQKYFIPLFVFALFVFGCKNEEIIPEEETTIKTPDWTEATHGNDSSPDYAKVFKQNEVIRIDLKIDETSWASMQADLKSIMGSNTSGNQSSYDPVWVPCSVFFDGIEWYKVGVRYKGNSSLKSTYKMGISKYSFKLDFDQFEDDYPAIKNQRFYGFKQLNLKNNYDDKALIREKVAADLFREFGLASSQTAFCAVYVDYGSGAKYFGLYTMVEEVDDTVTDSQYPDGSGNLYKPDGAAASFASGTFNESQMDKQNNEDLNDYSDVKALYNVINSTTRSTAPDEWKTGLEKVFDVDIFLKWLAANTVIQNWDTYGRMTHNYFLYNNPEYNRLNWIPWDNNEAFQYGKQGGSLNLSLSEVGSNWPLIRYIIDVPEYKLQYHAYLKKFIDEIFIPSKMTALYESYFGLLKDYAYSELSGYSFINSDTEFDTAIQTLKNHVSARNSAVLNYLESNN